MGNASFIHILERICPKFYNFRTAFNQIKVFSEFAMLTFLLRKNE